MKFDLLKMVSFSFPGNRSFADALPSVAFRSLLCQLPYPSECLFLKNAYLKGTWDGNV